MPPEKQDSFDPGNRSERDERLHRFSHELKNRLGSLWQATTLLRGTNTPAERDLLVEMAEKSYFQGARALEELLDDFDVARGVPTLHRTRVDLVPLIQECIQAISFRCERKNQQVKLQGLPKLEVHGDADLLKELFTALLSNACKFAPSGATTTVTVEQEGECARVSVTDQGVGLTPEDIEQVFVRYAVLSSRSTNGESQARSTLGRALPWARAHGGDLRVQSGGSGKGTTFTVELPL